MPKIILPTQISQIIGISQLILKEKTVDECITKLTNDYPAIKPYFYNENYRNYLNVYLNGINTRFNIENKILSSADCIEIIVNLAGG